jgi:hypothetical protein
VAPAPPAPSASRAISGLAAARRPASPAPSAPRPAEASSAPARAAQGAVATMGAISTNEVVDAALDAGADVSERWKAALATIHERKRLLGAFLEECHFMGRAGERLIVAMDDLHRAVVEEKENRLIVGEAVRRAFGDGAVLQCAPLEAAGPAAQRPSEEQTNAMVTKALQWFGTEARPAAVDERTEE